MPFPEMSIFGPIFWKIAVNGDLRFALLLKIIHFFSNVKSFQRNFKTYEQDWMDKQINRMEATQEKNMKNFKIFIVKNIDLVL